MKKLFTGGHYKIFLVRMLFVFALFTLTRILFFIFNKGHFNEIVFTDFIYILLAGLRFDTSAIIAFYSVFIIQSIIPFHLKHRNFYQIILLIIYTITTAIAMAGNLLDCAYFRYTFSRTTSDIFNVLGLGSDFSILFTQYLKDFWYIFLIWIFLTILSVLFFLKTKVVEVKIQSLQNIFSAYIKELFIFIILIAICIVGIRGGFQLRPITIMTAGQYTSAKNVALVLNTPFIIMKTIDKHGVKNNKYFNDIDLNKIYSPIHNYYKKNCTCKKNNIVIIVLESFSKEYIGELNKNLDNGNYKGYTPFLDSLIKQSLYFPNAYANGKRSIESIPSIFAGIPSLINDAYITSMYSGNNIMSLASTLHNLGYSSAFFHGGTNGTMGFDVFAKLAGFDNYYGRSEYNNEKDYDGKWGIYDEEFLQFIANKLDAYSQPFIAGVFTLSSHHPYKIPEKYLSKFPEGKLSIFKSILYTDFALKKFFEKISKKSWFDSTLFIITADHTSESEFPQYQTQSGIYAIPLLFYKHNSNIKGENKNIVQQTDIMPSILDYMNYNKNFIAFGESVFDTSDVHFAINYINETYQFFYKNYIYIFDIKKDLLMKNDLLKKQTTIAKEIENRLKAVIQSYSQRLIKNDMYVSN